MKKLLVLCPTQREIRYLPAIADSLNYQLVFEEFGGSYFDDALTVSDGTGSASFEILPAIRALATRLESSDFDGITSAVGYPGTPVASIVARHLDLPGPGIEQVLRCDHKYYSRLSQRTSAPQETPRFELADPKHIERDVAAFGYPCFLKPVKSCFSINANIVNSEAELEAITGTLSLPREFLRPFNELLTAFTDFQHDGFGLLAETVLQGQQVSVEGYVYRGEVNILGIIDSIMYPGTMSFKRFQYPSKLTEQTQSRIRVIVRRIIEGIRYDNAMFNVELMYNEATDDIKIIEINPKIASQFTDLFEKVDGTSSYEVMLRIAAGDPPFVSAGKGEFRIAASCVLRMFEDCKVLKVPTDAELAHAKAEFPDAHIEINAIAGQYLSSVMQDGKSFRYGVINIGANSEEELACKLERCRSLLKFDFQQ